MTSTRLAVGDRAPDPACTTLTGEKVSPVGRPGQSVILKFYRFANCPLCNLHVREWVRRADEVRAAGLTTLAVFHAKVMGDNMRAMGAGYLGMLPFGHEGGIRGHQADFLIGPDGVVRMAHYGAHYADTLTVDDVLAAATPTTPAPPPAAAPRRGGRR